MTAVFLLLALFIQGADPAGTDADSCFARGMMLARLQQWDAARVQFENGLRHAPGDARFVVELAGVAFRRNRYREAQRLLQRALQMRPGDEYASDFLATIHLLNGNTRGALAVWNRTGKPRIEAVRSIPEPALEPVLFDRSTLLRPASLALLRDYDGTLDRLEMLGVFRLRALELVPRRDGTFDLEVRTARNNGLNDSLAAGLAGLLRGIPYGTVYPEFFNLRHSAVNLTSAVRWDPRKRKLTTSLSAPVARDPAKRLQFDLDARDEEWNFDGDQFRMKRIGSGLSIALAAGSWRIRSGGTVAFRTFGGADPVPQESDFRRGASLEYGFSAARPLLSLPGRRFEIPSEALVRAGRMFGKAGGAFSSLVLGLRPQWYPQQRGSDFRMTGRLQAGVAVGATPFDGLFSFGLERDNDLGMRGHRGTLDGRKGLGPLGTGFFLGSWELDKAVAGTGLWHLTAGPFVDTGRMWHSAAPKWLTDVGLQARVSVLKLVSLTVSYGTDLRSGRHVVYFTTSSLGDFESSK